MGHALRTWREGWCLAGRDILHLAPEPIVGRLLNHTARSYRTADLDACHYGADLAVDLRALAIKADSFDVLVACHVLKHIVEDHDALAEVLRVLRPNGVAVLMVPVTARRTTDWGAVDSERNWHARECGVDYFDRYAETGFRVENLRTEDFKEAQSEALWTQEGNVRTSHWVSFCTKEEQTSA